MLWIDWHIPSPRKSPVGGNRRVRWVTGRDAHNSDGWTLLSAVNLLGNKLTGQDLAVPVEAH